MKQLENYIISISAVLNKPIALLFSFSLLSLTNVELAALLLIAIVIIDYATGVYASWFEFKMKKRRGELCDAEIKKGWFSSDKWRNSIIKSVAYLLFILLTYAFQYVFNVKKFHFESFFNGELSLTLITIIICFAVDFYSIFWENLPKVGVDIPQKSLGAVNKIKSFIKNIKS